MKNKKFIIGFTILIALMCAYFLSFTLLSRKVQSDAEKYAIGHGGQENDHLKLKYLDSVWNEPVIDFLGIDFTYKEIKEMELNLGLDLKGGLYLVLEVSQEELVEKIAGNNSTPEFLEAVKKADKNKYFLGSFYDEYRKLTDEPLAKLFVSVDNKDYIDLESTDGSVMAYLEKEMEDAVTRTLEILRNRIDQYGVASPNIQRLPGTQRIQVELSGVDNPERVKNLLKGLAKLEFWEVWDMNSLQPVLETINRQWLSRYTGTTEPQEIKTQKDNLADQLNHQDSSLYSSNPLVAFLKPGYGLKYSLSDTAKINDVILDENIKTLLPKNLVFKWQAKSETVATGEKLLELYPLKTSHQHKPVLTGDVISDARQDFDNGVPAVSMAMNGEGTKQWKKITANSIGQQIAIVLDDKVYSAPVVQSEIPNGNSSITGDFTLEEAKDLANILKSGKMPAKIKVVEEAVVGPTLGKETIGQGIISLLAGMCLVLIFMSSYYGKGGNIANLAVLINVFFILGILAQFGASLTLPGVAGIVLTIGMSVDANVLIYERIREELRSGKSLSLAIKWGYDKAYSSIIDSNVTTFLVGLILYIFGSGGIKGFAVVLMIGIICSVFTAVFLTRLFLERMVRKGKIHSGSFNTLISKGITGSTKIDYLKYRKYAYLFSSAIIVIGIGISLIMGSYRFGVDFKGGHSFVVKFEEPVKAHDVRSILLESFGNSGLEVKTYNDATQLRVTTSYLIESNADNADQIVRSTLETGLEKLQNNHPEIIGYSKVGASIADDIKESSKVVVVVALIVIFLYVLIRFQKWQYGFGAVIALFHDVMMIFAFYGLAGFFGLNLEIDQTFIAAVLTIIGYSINDTVVVYDRIREFSGKIVNKEQFSLAVNPAISNTLTRTVVTSFTVFIVAIILLFLAGEVLRGFAFALLVGVIFGTYSSIFIASPLAVDLMKEKKLLPPISKNSKKAA